MLDVPACMTWPIPPVGDNDELAMRLWQDGRCGACGQSEPPGPAVPASRSFLVLDHDHATDLIRGYLCRSCNSLEPHSTFPVFVRWRAGWNPAGLMGVVDEYDSPFEERRRILRNLWPEPTAQELRDAINSLPGA